ncbi:MAG: PAS domain-containing protein [Gammaproteobacteria bacterium]|nr:MAG: PAS domain-containing protein [Gammaproteobacteria bacterium]
MRAPDNNLTPRPLLALLVALLLVAGSRALASPGERPEWLTVDEKVWLDRHPVIRVGPAPHFPPVEFFDAQGTYTGLASDYLREISHLLNVRFEVRRLETWQDVVDATQAGEIDMWPEAVSTAPRRLYMRFTQPYVRLPALIITRQETGLLTPEDLEGLTVVGVRGYASTNDFLRRFPHIAITQVDTIAQALQKVAWREADAAIAASGPAVWFQQKLGLTNLHVAGQTGFTIELAMAVRKDWPELARILDKALEHLPESTHQQIQHRWVRLEVATWSPQHTTLIATAIVLALILIAGILAWNRSLKRVIAQHSATLTSRRQERARDQQQLAHMQQRLSALFNLSTQPLLLCDTDGRIRQMNQSAFRLFELTEDDLEDFRYLSSLVTPGQNVSALDKQWKQLIAAGEGRMIWQIRSQLSMVDREVEAFIRVMDSVSPPLVWIALTDKTGLSERLEERAAEFRHLYTSATQALARLQENQDALHNSLMHPDTAHDSAALLASQQNALQTLQRMVEDACTAGLFSCKPPEVSPETIHLSDFMDDQTRSELDLAAQRFGVQISVLPLDPELTVWADRRALKEVMRYLFRIAGHLANPDSTVAVSAQRASDHVTLSINYHGRPAPEPGDHPPLSRELAQHPGLTGYELYLARQYLNAQSGRLIIDSAGDLSTILHVRLLAHAPGDAQVGAG